ncbi:hypothetical protein LCGC14_2317380, partial [marine sediment metagenome]
MTGAMTFLPTEGAGISFAKELKRSGPTPAVIELLDSHSLDIFRRHKRGHEQSPMRCDIPGGTPSAIYVEYHGPDADSIGQAVGEMAEIMASHGGDRGAVWTGSSVEDIANFKQIRHVLPELVNGLVGEQQRIEPRICKLGTDLAVPDE